jgi:hypothetical protein
MPRTSHTQPRCKMLLPRSAGFHKGGKAFHLIDVLRIHPATIIGGILQKNPFFVSPDELLHERRKRAGRAPSA